MERLVLLASEGGVCVGAAWVCGAEDDVFTQSNIEPRGAANGRKAVGTNPVGNTTTIHVLAS